MANRFVIHLMCSILFVFLIDMMVGSNIDLKNYVNGFLKN